MDQPKLERMLRLMKYLSGNVNYSIAELGRKLEMSPRTVYRYIDYFREIVLGGVVPSLETHLVLAGFALAALLAGVFMYKHYNTKFLYYV